MSPEQEKGPATAVLAQDQGEPDQEKGCVLVVARGHGSDSGRYVVLREGVATVGTDENADLPLRDENVSRHHLEAEAVPGGLLIRDLGSTNGTRYLGSTIERATVRIGGRLSLGKTTLLLLPHSEETPGIQPADFTQYHGILGESTPMRRLFSILERLESTEVPVLIQGETGTGKELAARAIHSGSPRQDGPFVIVDCGSIPGNLANSELFGHIKGAFTGASASRIGAFEEAHGGTLFLDEIGELPIAQQPQLLRALEAKEIKRVGETTYRPIDVRIVAATNRDLRAAVDQQTFREDLFYRLAVVRVRLPPLRSRPEDVPVLANEFAAELGRSEPLPDQVITMLTGHSWPGNVRELRNAVMQLLSLGTVEDLLGDRPAGGTDIGVNTALPYKEARDLVLDRFEGVYLRELLQRTDNNISLAARTAGLTRKYLKTLMTKHGLRSTES